MLKLLDPTSVCGLLVLAAALLHRRKKLSHACLWGALAVLMICGNGWLVGGLTRHLEMKHLSPNPVPEADCLVILSGGILSATPPRPTIEVDQAGNRVLYGAHLFREHRAPWVVCTGGFLGGKTTGPSMAEEMAGLLQTLNVPASAIITETQARRTAQHAENLEPVFRERQFRKVLLVTSALHMPRSLGVFRHRYPGIEFIAAPTDFRGVNMPSAPFRREFTALIPSTANLHEFSLAMHEYLGIAYYKIRGWM